MSRKPPSPKESPAKTRARRPPSLKADLDHLIGRGRLVGWREWVALPDLGVPRLKAKIDTGARTSALHAVNLRPFETNGLEWLAFTVEPHVRGGSDHAAIECRAPLWDRRAVRNSGGSVESRYVIKTALAIGGRQFEIEVTLTNRSDMGFEMLVGRTALRTGRLFVHPARSFVQGK